MIDQTLEGADEQELGERLDAAQHLAEEDPDLYVDWVHDAINLSEESTRDIRSLWDECYNAYQFKINFPDKEDWMTKMATGEINAMVKQATAVIKKAFKLPNWFSIDEQGAEDVWLAKFAREALTVWLNAQHAKMGPKFSRASELGFIIGQSHEMIPRWIPGQGLQFTLIPPWQICRDPDAEPNDPWSGDFWVHFEWMDLWKIKALGNQYVRLDEVTPDEGRWGVEDQEKRARRKGQFYQRTPRRHTTKIIEYWGVVLDKQGDLLHDNVRFTVAGDVLIRNPEPNPYVNLKWPGVSFTPLPDLFAFEGHGIVESSLLLWLYTCNLMSLHLDDISWRVNKVRQLNRWKLEDPTDTHMHPGKLLLLADHAQSGEKVLEEVFNSSNTSEILATLQDWRQLRENTSFVSQFVTGLPGDRSKITKGEVEIKTGQSMNIFDSIGEDIEDGAVNVLKAALEVIILNWYESGTPSISRVLGDSPEALQFAEMPIEQRKELLQSNCDIKISGISAQIKNSEVTTRLQWLMNKAEQSSYTKYFKPFRLLKQGTNALGFYDPDFLVTDEQAEQIDQVEATLKRIAEMAAQIDGQVPNIQSSPTPEPMPDTGVNPMAGMPVPEDMSQGGNFNV